MTWRNLFNIPISGPAQAAAVIPGQAVAASAPAPAQTVGSFVTPESVATFSGMTAAIPLIWTFIEGVGGIQHRLWIGAAIAVCCGALLYGADASDPNRSPSPARQWRILAALVNTILLFNAASVGIPIITPAQALAILQS